MIRVGAFILMVVGVTHVVWAQVPEEFQPVDQAVEDLDPLATSLRRVEKGLRYDGEHTNLFKVFELDAGPDSQPTYYRIGPGVTARVHRLDYLVRTGEKGLALNIKTRLDGEFIELIPADTVFELRSLEELIPDEAWAEEIAPPSRHYIDARIDCRVEGYFDGAMNPSIDARTIESTPPTTTNTSSAPLPTE